MGQEQRDKFEGRTLIKTVTLPSRGLLYGDRIPEGKVRVAAFKTSEQKIFAGTGEAGEDRMDMALRNCIDAGSFPPSELLVGDSLFCLFWIRALSFGRQDYGFNVKCEDCDKFFRKDFDLPDDLELFMAPDDLSEPFEVTLPHCGKVVGLRSFRRKDEADVTHYTDKKIREMGEREAGKGDPGYEYKLAKHIVSVDGDDMPSPSTAVHFVQKYLEGPDLYAFTGAIDEHYYGYEVDLEFPCRHCGFPQQERMPLTAEFFRPRRTRRVRRDPSQ